MLKNVKNTIAGNFFAAPCTLAVSYIENSKKSSHRPSVNLLLANNSKHCHLLINYMYT